MPSLPVDLSRLLPDDPRRRRKAALLRLGERAATFAGAAPKASRSIIVAGSGRSGTTWVSEVLSASPRTQQIFEPMNPVWVPQVRNLTGWDARRLHPRSYYLAPAERDEAWERFFQQVLLGAVRNGWTDPLRTSFFPKKYVVKLIRANLMLGWIAERFAPRIVLVTRDPVAVVASRMRLGWSVDPQDLLRQEGLVRDYLGRWESKIAKERRPAAQHAIAWATEHLVATHQLAGRRHLRVQFEELVRDPLAQFPKVFAWLGLQVPKNLAALVCRPSAQAAPEESYSGPAERVAGHKSRLSPGDLAGIDEWVRELGVAVFSGHDESRA